MERSPRLAELVVHLTGCSPEAAVAAVADSGACDGDDDALRVVARAICSLRRIDLTDTVDLRTSSRVATNQHL
ncbi:MAG TPA: hypothetical protein VGZ52_03340 [Acidimicrobiales bacterium]|jgi:hypothetical protein|nr:hypothetical protein [Acidimicrobiales bacterium]